MMRATVLGAVVASLVPLAQCDPLIFNWEDVFVSNENGCGAVTVSTSNSDTGYNGVFFQENVVVYNKTETPSCQASDPAAIGPRHAAFATTGTNFAKGPIDVQIVHAPNVEFVNGVSFTVGFDTSAVPVKLDDSAVFQFSVLLSDFNNGDNTTTFTFNVNKDGTGPHAISITGITFPYILFEAESFVVVEEAPVGRQFFNVPFYTDNMVFETQKFA